MTTFGEIVEPVSRAAWEDWDEIVPEQNNVVLTWQGDVQVEKINTFVIVEGKYLSELVTKQAQHELELINTVPQVNLHLYKVKTLNKYICICKDYNLVLSSDIVNLLKPYLDQSENVIAIQTKPLAEYQSTVYYQDSAIRSVSTSKTSPKSLGLSYKKLEQPNIITGVAAGAVCLREFQELPGTAIVCYIVHPEEYQIEGIQNLLKALDIIGNVKSKPTNVLNSNLYI